MSPVAAPVRPVRRPAPAPRRSSRRADEPPRAAYATEGSAVLAPQRRPAPQPVRREEPRPRHLRVVAPRERARRRLTPATGLFLSALLFVMLFALAVSHTVLVQGQIRLDDLDSRLAVEQARYQELRTEVAELESPARVVAAAEQRGMVIPDDLVYLQPSAPDPTTAPADGSTDAGAVAGSGGAGLARDAEGGWSSMKPLLQP